MEGRMHWYVEALKKYAVFSGRARRKEYWYFVLFNLLVAAGLGVVGAISGLVLDNNVNLLATLYSLAVIVPGIAVSVRRLHDGGHSGWWLLLIFVPFVGALFLLIFMLQDGLPGQNKWGPNPKQMAMAA
jgi:uncharacterized membrane protein YhaH (DUF805 family)